MTEAEIMKEIETLLQIARFVNSDYVTSPFEKKVLLAIQDLINSKNAEIERLEYTLAGVMHSVDKWLDGDELKQDEVNRAVTMREKTLRIVETARGEAIKEFTERLGLYWQQFVIDEIREFATKAGLDPVYSFNPTEKELNEKYKDILKWLAQIAKELGVEL